MISKSQEIEERAIERIADLMCVAARTAPKGRGVDNLVILQAKGRIKDQLADEMRRIAKATGAGFFERDAGCVDKAMLIVLIAQKVQPRGVTPCGFCGYENCGEAAKNNGVCAVAVSDLGIAVGSAVSAAAHYHVDNRIMFSIGKAALNLDIFGEDVGVAYGIPLSISGKSPFYDR